MGTQKITKPPRGKMIREHENRFIKMYIVIHLVGIYLYVAGYTYTSYVFFCVVGYMIIEHMKFTMRLFRNSIND